MTIDITQFLNAIIALAAALITGFLIPWIRSKTTTQQRDEIMEWVKIAVSAAEMIYKGSGRGQEKLAYVLNFLTSKGVKIDTESVRTMIEAAVLQLPAL